MCYWVCIIHKRVHAFPFLSLTSSSFTAPLLQLRLLSFVLPVPSYIVGLTHSPSITAAPLLSHFPSNTTGNHWSLSHYVVADPALPNAHAHSWNWTTMSYQRIPLNTFAMTGEHSLPSPSFSLTRFYWPRILKHSPWQKGCQCVQWVLCCSISSLCRGKPFPVWPLPNVHPSMVFIFGPLNPDQQSSSCSPHRAWKVNLDQMASCTVDGCGGGTIQHSIGTLAFHFRCLRHVWIKDNDDTGASSILGWRAWLQALTLTRLISMVSTWARTCTWTDTVDAHHRQWSTWSISQWAPHTQFRVRYRPHQCNSMRTNALSIQTAPSPLQTRTPSGQRSSPKFHLDPPPDTSSRFLTSYGSTMSDSTCTCYAWLG